MHIANTRVNSIIQNQINDILLGNMYLSKIYNIILLVKLIKIKN